MHAKFGRGPTVMSKRAGVQTDRQTDRQRDTAALYSRWTSLSHQSVMPPVESGIMFTPLDKLVNTDNLPA